MKKLWLIPFAAAALMGVADDEATKRAMAVFMFSGVLVSLGVGPYIAAFVSEQLYPSDQGLGKAMTALTYGVVPLLIAGLLLTRKAFATAMCAAAERERVPQAAHVDSSA